MKSEVLEKAGKKVVLLGNEAIARGALEAGVGVVTAYPGTPSSEVPMVLSPLAKDLGFHFEYSVNEKVALETAAGAAWSGVRSLTAMKHFGLNVAADSLVPLAYTGIKAGLVIFVADDPGAWSSVQSEQDSRYYARLAKLPMLEPSNPQECLEMTKAAFELSEEFELPVLLRTTTKVSHSIGTVELGPAPRRRRDLKGQFQRDRQRFYNFRPQLQELHQKLNKKIERMCSYDPCGRLNQTIAGDGQIGIITSGVGFEYVKEACQILGINPPIAKIGLTYPISKKFIGDFIKDKKTVLVIEELEPMLEDFVIRVAKDSNPRLKILGKSSYLSRVGEYDLETIISAFQQAFGTKQQTRVAATTEVCHSEKTLADLPPRKPVMCPGCPHRSTFYAVKKVFPDAVYAGDIGCYMMGAFEPFQVQDFIISMGAGLGLAHGISCVSNQEVVAFVGDSTFFHAGMPALLNYKFNADRTPLVIVMDNGTTAMTGHQPNPGAVVKIEEIAKAFGAEVRVANSFNQKQLLEALKELKEIKGPRVLVSRGECRLLTRRKMRQKGQALQTFKVVDAGEFKRSKLMEEFSCPAFQKSEEGLSIDSDLCWGCAVCSQLCPKGVTIVNPKYCQP